MIPSTFELLLGDAWTDITSDVYQRDEATITRGRPDEGSKTDPGKLSLTLNNRGGRYSPRNPESDLYGQLGRNTPVRVRQGTRVRALALPGVEGSHLSTPDSAALDITGDIDIRIDVEPNTWRPAELAHLAAKYEYSTGDLRSWSFELNSDGTLALRTTSDGSTQLMHTSTASVASDSGRLAVRATMDVDNGASEHVVEFYTAPDITGTWTQLGTAVVQSGTTSLFNTPADLTIGTVNDGTIFIPGVAFSGTVHAFELRDGIGGALVADIGTLDDAEPGQDTFTDDAGLTWTLHDSARVADSSIRMAGEVAEWPPRWDLSGSDVYTPIEAAGVLRRLGNAASPLRSPVRRGTVAAPAVVAYWPMEDGESSVSLASGLDGGNAMTIARSPKLAASDVFVASEPLPQMGTGKLTGMVDAYPSGSGEWQVQFLLAVPEGGLPAQNQILEVRTTGSARRFSVEVDTAGWASMFVRSPTGAVLDDTGKFDFALNGKPVRFALEVEQVGSDVDYAFAIAEPGASSGTVVRRTVAGQTIGNVARIVVGGRPGEDLADTTIGHVSARSAITSIFELSAETDAYRGEPAGRRIARLCSEQGIVVGVEGNLDDTAAMGPQGIATLLDLLREAAEADMGILGELRDMVGMHYRTRKSLYNRPVSATLDYTASELAPPLEPVEDDSTIANDVTVDRDGGSSARVVQETGPLSVQAPPEGVGRYDTSVTLNLHSDEQVRPQAEWRLHAGTIDQLRYPTITVQASDPAGLYERVAPLRPGDRVQITNPPSWLPPHTIDLTVEGTEETLNPFLWEWQANTSPAVVHQVFELNHDVYGRLASDGSHIATDITSTDATFDVVSTGDSVWTEDAAHMPFDVLAGGERMTINDVSPAVVDTFSRTVTDGWGTSDTGRAWTISGTAADFDVDGSVGTIALPTAGEFRSATYGATSAADIDVQTTVSLNVVPTDGLIYAALDARAGGGDYYVAQVEWRSDGRIWVTLYRVVSGTSTLLGEADVTDQAAGKRVIVRGRFIADHLQVALWPASTYQRGWDIDVTDDAVPGPGEVRIRTYRTAANTNSGAVVSVDDVQSGNLQQLDVTRSVNGIVKSHSAGTGVQVADLGVLALG